MNINEISKRSHDNAVNKGFYECSSCNGEKYTFVDDKLRIGKIQCIVCNGTGKAQKNIGELLMLVVSELGECLESHRKNRFTVKDFLYNDSVTHPNGFESFIKDTFEDELADAVIRICDLCGYLGIDLEKHIELKMRYNETREYKHGKKY